MKYPLFKVHIDIDEALKNIKEVFESGYIAEGVQVKQFAEALEPILETDQIVLLNSCTSSLTLAMRLAGVGPGDEVVTTSATCLASNTPIINLGAKPVWADIDHRTAMIDPKEVEKKITSKTKAVVCVAWAGIPPNLARLLKICSDHGVKLILDAAHAFGAKYWGRSVSRCADYVCYSLQAVKHISSVDGGILVCKNKKDHERAMKLKWFGIDREKSKDEKGSWKGQAWDFDVEEAGYKFHMNNVSAAIGLSQMKHVRKLLNIHIQNGNLYNNIFFIQREFDGCIKSLDSPEGSQPVYWVYTVIVDPLVDRDAVLEDLNQNYGIGAALVHVPNHRYGCFKASYCDLPETDKFHQRQISLPCGWWLRPEDIGYIAESLIKSCDQHRGFYDW